LNVISIVKTVLSVTVPIITILIHPSSSDWASMAAHKNRLQENCEIWHNKRGQSKMSP